MRELKSTAFVLAIMILTGCGGSFIRPYAYVKSIHHNYCVVVPTAACYDCRPNPPDELYLKCGLSVNEALEMADDINGEFSRKQYWITK